jgi:hypothetical protein
MTGYQYTLIKYVHNDASGECVNVGLALLAPEERFLRVGFNQRYSRISRFFLDAFDGDHYRNMVRALTDRFDRMAETLKSRADSPDSSEVVPNDLATIMETALPRDATAFRWGPIYGGGVADVEGRFHRLFAEFVTRHDKPVARPLRQESQMWSDFERLARQRHLEASLRPFTLSSDVYRYEFHGSFQNGKPNVIEPISLDLLGGSSIVEKANQWAGRLLALKLSQDFAFHAILAPPADESLRPYFDRARRLLSTQEDVVKHLIVEKEDQDQLEDLFREIGTAGPG